MQKDEIRERLIDVLDRFVYDDWYSNEEIADYLIANGVTIQEWIPVSERLPQRGGEYLCLCNVDGHVEYPFFMVLRYYLVDKNPHFQHECEHGLHVTHWMPLPEPPKEVE